MEHATSVRKIDYDMKMFPQTVLVPLEEMGVIEVEEHQRQGAKPNRVRLSKKAVSEFLVPFLQNIAKLCSVEESELNKSFDEVLVDVQSNDKQQRGEF